NCQLPTANCQLPTAQRCDSAFSGLKPAPLFLWVYTEIAQSKMFLALPLSLIYTDIIRSAIREVKTKE
ncbi:hypothetical protein, partial [Yersinia ruckeri]